MKDSFDKFFSFHCAAPSYIFHQHPAWFSLLNSRQIAATNLLRQSFRLSFSPVQHSVLLSLDPLLYLEISGVNYTLPLLYSILGTTKLCRDRFVNDENEPLLERIRATMQIYSIDMQQYTSTQRANVTVP
jgi:hypothetical protein